MKSKIIWIASVIMLISTACKPTEKGYQAAYDAALNKRQAAISDINVTITEGDLVGEGVQSVDGPQLKEINGVKVYVLNRVIRPVKDDIKMNGPYNVAVGLFKMNTNCEALSEALKNEGFDSFAAKDPEGTYYSIAGSFKTLQEAVELTQKLQKKSDRSYVGLPSSPVIIFSPL